VDSMKRDGDVKKEVTTRTRQDAAGFQLPILPSLSSGQILKVASPATEVLGQPFDASVGQKIPTNLALISWIGQRISSFSLLL
jgi:hypothetical protein